MKSVLGNRTDKCKQTNETGAFRHYANAPTNALSCRNSEGTKGTGVKFFVLTSADRRVSDHLHYAPVLFPWPPERSRPNLTATDRLVWVLPSPKRNLLGKKQSEREVSAAVNSIRNYIHLTIIIYKFSFHLIENNHDKDKSVKAVVGNDGFYNYSLNHANQTHNILLGKNAEVFMLTQIIQPATTAISAYHMCRTIGLYHLVTERMYVEVGYGHTWPDYADCMFCCRVMFWVISLQNNDKKNG
jgi:hypothetical protein